MEYVKVLLLLWSLAFRHHGECYEMAKLYNSRLMITSSTLAWTNLSPGETLPPNVVTVGSGGPPWCRAWEHAVWVPGALLEGQCHMPFLGSVLSADAFHVLVSENGSARLETVSWDALVALPPNVVSTPDMLLAVSHGEGGVPGGLPGFVEPQEKRAHFLKGNETVGLREGFLLTEVEPISYRLTEVRLGEQTQRPKIEEELQEFVLENPYESAEEVSSEVKFVAPHIVYFGRMKGTLVNLPTAVSGPDTFPVGIRWGITNEMSQNRTHTVTYHLPAQSSVKVRLIAVIRNLEGPYSGRLTSVYEDGVERERNIEGLHRERKLAELRADFDQVVSLVNGASLEQWPPQSTILLHSTTTTSAPPSAYSDSSSGTQILPKPAEVGVNGVGFSFSVPPFLISLLLFLLSW